MKVFLVFIISIFLFVSNDGQFKFWEDLSCKQKTEIYEVCKSESIKKFYDGDFVLSDDETTDELLNELIASNDTILPLSFYVFNKICTQSDGALSEMVGRYCLLFITKHPVYVFLYLNRCDNDKLQHLYA